MSLRWYVVHAYSNYEHKVKQSLEERIERFGLGDKFGEILISLSHCRSHAVAYAVALSSSGD